MNNHGKFLVYVSLSNQDKQIHMVKYSVLLSILLSILLPSLLLPLGSKRFGGWILMEKQNLPDFVTLLSMKIKTLNKDTKQYDVIQVPAFINRSFHYINSIEFSYESLFLSQVTSISSVCLIKPFWPSLVLFEDCLFVQAKRKYI